MQMYLRGSLVFLLLVLSTGLVLAGSGMSPSITRLDFSIAAPQIGLPGSAVALEVTLPGENVDADIYTALGYPPPPFSNLKVYDDNLLLGYSPPDVLADDIDALLYHDLTNPYWDPATTPSLFIQFSVDRNAVGLPGTAVSLEAAAGEAAGDVYQSFPPFVGVGTNALISDEDAQGLFAPGGSIDELDALDLETSPTAFMDRVYSLQPGNTPGYAPADLIDSWGTNVVALWFFSDLGLLPTDDLDALYIVDIPGGMGPYVDVWFSLAPGSPTLQGFNGLLPQGCDPGDILVSTPTAFAGAGVTWGPVVRIRAPNIGLLGDGLPNDGSAEDNLDALEFSGTPYVEIGPSGPGVADWYLY